MENRVDKIDNIASLIARMGGSYDDPCMTKAWITVSGLLDFN